MCLLTVVSKNTTITSISTVLLVSSSTFIDNKFKCHTNRSHVSTVHTPTVVLR